MLRDFLLALSFLTRCPVPQRIFESNQLQFSRAFVFFPLIGALLGTVIAGFLAVSRYLFPTFISGFLATGLILWLTRALHLDGFADWIDGLGGGYTPEKRREIMKDSRIGTFGAASITIIIGIKAFSMGVLQQAGAWQGIIIAPVCGRFAMGLLAWRAQGNNQGLGAKFIEGFSWKILVLSFMWFLPFLFWHPVFAIVAMVTSISEVLLLKRGYIASFGAITGDLFGATCEIVETTIFLLGVAFFRIP
ncbi:MAG: adenosylcobinamide-GDP ribazoletransferase [Thermodesulforhabdaceae bacterium]